MAVARIDYLPDIPEELRIAAKSGRLIPFIGAGASRIANCSSWDGFADGLLDQLVQRDTLNHSQAQQIRDQGLPPRMKLSFVRNIAKQASVDLDYETIVHPKRDRNHSDGRRLYRALGRLSKAFITTNYDYWLDAELGAPALAGAAEDPGSAATADADRPNIIFKKSDFTFSRLMVPGTVIHLHGSLRSPSDMIVTTSDYLEFYRSTPTTAGGEQNSVLTFLRTLFNERVVLFIGYGLGDLELLEYVVLKGQSAPKASKHYILQPFFSRELEIANLYERYYQDDCGLTMLPFSKDRRNHLQLVEVAEYLATQIPGGDLMAAERQAQMEKMLDVP